MLSYKFQNPFKIVFFLTFLFRFSSVAQSPSETKVAFKMDVAADATPSVLARVLQAETQPISEIVFEKGVYHFYPDRALEVFCNISNHNDVFVYTAFPLFNLKNLTIDGQGSTFIFHGLMVPFLVDKSENIHIKNVSIDWATPFHSEGLVVANNPKEKSFDLEISDKYPYEIRNNQLIFIKEYYEHSLGQSILFDPKTRATTFQTENYTPLTTFQKNSIKYKTNTVKYKYKTDPRAPENQRIGREDKLLCKEIQPGLVRIFNHAKDLPPVGNILVSKGEQGQNRVAPAIRVTASKNFMGTNVNVYHAGGMGLIVENTTNIRLEDFNILPSEGRVISTTADATHFVGCKGKIDINHCTFQNQLDDAVNIHGTYQEVVEVLGKNKLGIRMGHFQQGGFKIGMPNDKIGLVRLNDSFFNYTTLTLQSIQEINKRYQILTFNEPIPAQIKVGDYIENLDAYPEVSIKNCTISRNRARGLLLSSPKKTVIENNYFSTEMEAILVPVESGFWFELGSALDLTIRNNTFQDCVASGQNRGVIRFVTDDENEHIAFKNVHITNNTFNHFDNLILEVSNTDNLTFTSNTITNSGNYKMLFPDNPVIKVRASKNLIFEKNKINTKSKSVFQTDEKVPRKTY